MAQAGVERALTETQQKAFHTKVTESLWAFEEIDAQLRDKIRDYLVSGEDASCVLELPAAMQLKGRKRFFKQQKHGVIRAADRVNKKNLAGLFDVGEAAPGYYLRLGEIAGQIPEVKQAQLETDERVPEWLNHVILLRWLLTTDGYASYTSNRNDTSFKLAPILADLQDESEFSTLISLVLGKETTGYAHISRHLASAGDWAVILADRADQISNSIRACDASAREDALSWLKRIEFANILPVIAELAVSSSKRVRPLALQVLREANSETAGQLLCGLLTNGNAAERANAAETVVVLLGDAAESHLRSALKDEKGKRVRQAIESQLTQFEIESNGSPEEDVALAFELPDLELDIGAAPLPDGFADALWDHLQAALDKVEAQYQKQLEAYQAPDRPRWMSKPQKATRMDRKDFDSIMRFIEGETDKSPAPSRWDRQAADAMPLWEKWTDLKRLSLVQVARFLKAFRFVEYRHYNSPIYFTREDWLESHRNAQAKPYGLREVDAAFASLRKGEPGAVAKSYLDSNNAWRTFLDWEPDAVWPLFAEHMDIFQDAILGVTTERSSYWPEERRRTAIRVASMLPAIPRPIENAIWAVALGEGKVDRPLARRALMRVANLLPRALQGLADGKQAIRIAAAEMLAEIGDSEAIGSLKTALKKEKQELVKGAILQAIEKLGGDVDEFLGRRKQLLDAKKGLEKKRPKGMEWVPLDSLPRIRWAEDNKPVAKEIPQWWVVQSIQFKLPVCGPILRRAMAMCRQDDVAEFAKRLLADWSSYDVKTASRDEIVAEATAQAAKQWKAGGKWLKEYYKTEEKLRDDTILQLQHNFLQSAIGQKGMLAIVSASGDAQCVKLIERYIRTYHGHRLAQSKALLETLGWIEDPTAVQLLLSLANRFRTKAIRKRAAELVEEIANRQGWTMDQLADRTIPDAGFECEQDEDGNPIGERAELLLDYGSRKFSVILGDDLQAVITREDGKQVKTLPAAAKDDDPELVKAAKKAFSAAKKTVKEVVKNQAERLYEAACVQRSWPLEEWQRYLAKHPIAGALTRRVVWAAQPEDETQSPRLFRPLEDGSLTDVDDNELTLNETDRILIAHSSLLDEPTVEAWKQHLEDYEVPGLFQQFGRQTYRLPEAKQDETTIDDFQGHMLTTFRLRSRAVKLGWVRGEVEDGGCFWIYRKPFRSASFEAVLEFTGSYVPEEDLPAALREMYFVPLKPSGETQSWNPSKMKLGKVPPVLVSECYNDLREMAAEGGGFDPEWEKKGLW